MLFSSLLKIVVLFLQLLLWNFKSTKASPEEMLVPNESLSTENSYHLKLDSRIYELENEVARLNSKGDEDREVANQLTGRVERIEAILTNFMKECDHYKTNTRLKRPASLLPFQVLLEKPQNHSDENLIGFYGPPTNCEDLNKLGYTLNGYYLVKNQQSNNEKIQVIFCRFKMPEKTQDFQNFIGNLELKTKNVHFYVQRKTPFGKKGTIPFEIEKVNVGGAMNTSSGVFTVPLNGIYHFQFSGVKSHGIAEVYVILLVNGADVGRAFSSPETRNTFTTASLTASLKLKVGDRVNLFLLYGQLHDTTQEHFTGFNGWLAEEDFSLA